MAIVILIVIVLRSSNLLVALSIHPCGDKVRPLSWFPQDTYNTKVPLGGLINWIMEENVQEDGKSHPAVSWCLLG